MWRIVMNISYSRYVRTLQTMLKIKIYIYIIHYTIYKKHWHFFTHIIECSLYNEYNVIIII